MDIAKRIRQVGEPTGKITRRGSIIAKVKCQGCGSEIASDEDLSGVEWVGTKRGTDVFFHTECRDKVWKCGIR